MNTSDIQWEFTQDIAKLIMFAKDNNYKLTLGEAYRTSDQQKLYFYGQSITEVGLGIDLVSAPVRSKTMKSDHLNRLAIDFNIFYDYDKDGDKDYISDKKLAEKLGAYWESLNPKNYWGGRWGWDVPHFGRKL